MSPESSMDPVKEQPIPTIKSVEPGVEKSLEFHKVKDGTPPKVDDDKVRLTIVNEQGEKESVVVLYGDLNMALSVLGHNPAQAGGGGIPVDGSTPVGEPTNEGEDLTRTGSNPELDPVSPGVEPENAPVEGEGAPNAPASTDPGGNTAQQTAPDVTAPEPDGSNVTTNPGTESTSDAQTEVPQPEQPPAEPEPQPTVPAESVSEKPLYVDVTEDRSATWSYTPPFTEAGLVTPDGRTLYHYEGDVDGEPGKGAKDGTIGIYADEVVAPTPQENAS